MFFNKGMNFLYRPCVLGVVHFLFCLCAQQKEIKLFPTNKPRFWAGNSAGTSLPTAMQYGMYWPLTATFRPPLRSWRNYRAWSIFSFRARRVAAIVQHVLMVMWFSVEFEVLRVFIPVICWCFTIISFSFETTGLWKEELTKPLKTVCFPRSSTASNSLKQQNRLTSAHGSSCGLRYLYQSGEWIFIYR